MPGAVSRTSTYALNHVTLEYGLSLAQRGVVEAARRDPALAYGVNTFGGHITYEAVAQGLELPYLPLEEAFGK
jgi:alanine dehydrogenase